MPPSYTPTNCRKSLSPMAYVEMMQAIDRTTDLTQFLGTPGRIVREFSIQCAGMCSYLSASNTNSDLAALMREKAFADNVSTWTNEVYRINQKINEGEIARVISQLSPSRFSEIVGETQCFNHSFQMDIECLESLIGNPKNVSCECALETLKKLYERLCVWATLALYRTKFLANPRTRNVVILLDGEQGRGRIVQELEYLKSDKVEDHSTATLLSDFLGKLAQAIEHLPSDVEDYDASGRFYMLDKLIPLARFNSLAHKTVVSKIPASFYSSSTAIRRPCPLCDAESTVLLQTGSQYRREIIKPSIFLVMALSKLDHAML